MKYESPQEILKEIKKKKHKETNYYLSEPKEI